MTPIVTFLIYLVPCLLHFQFQKHQFFQSLFLLFWSLFLECRFYGFVIRYIQNNFAPFILTLTWPLVLLISYSMLIVFGLRKSNSCLDREISSLTTDINIYF